MFSSVQVIEVILANFFPQWIHLNGPENKELLGWGEDIERETGRQAKRKQSQMVQSNQKPWQGCTPRGEGETD